MAANPLEFRILPTAAEWFWRSGAALNLPKDVFSVRICPLGPGDHMLSQNLLVNVGIDPFAMETASWRPKSTRSAPHSTGITSFHPFAIEADPHRCLEAFYSNLENKAPADAEARGNLWIVEGGATRGTTALVYLQLHSSLYSDAVQGYWRTPNWSDRRQGCKQVSTEWFMPAQSSERLIYNKRSPWCLRDVTPTTPTMYLIAWTTTYRILFILPLSLFPQWRRAARKQYSIDRPTLYVVLKVDNLLALPHQATKLAALQYLTSLHSWRPPHLTSSGRFPFLPGGFSDSAILNGKGGA